MSQLDSSSVWSDAWLLLAIIYCGEAGGDLRSIIATADYLNHSVMTYEELSGGLARLKSAGYIAEREGKYLATDIVRGAYRQMTKPRRSVWKDLDDLESYLKTHTASAAALPEKILTRAVYDEAVRAYLESWRR